MIELYQLPYSAWRFQAFVPWPEWPGEASLKPASIALEEM